MGGYVKERWTGIGNREQGTGDRGQRTVNSGDSSLVGGPSKPGSEKWMRGAGGGQRVAEGGRRRADGGKAASPRKIRGRAGRWWLAAASWKHYITIPSASLDDGSGWVSPIQIMGPARSYSGEGSHGALGWEGFRPERHHIVHAVSSNHIRGGG